VARPTELSPEVADRIAQFIRAGNWPEPAAEAAGVSGRSFYRWMARGFQADQAHESGRSVEPSEEPYWRFWQQIRKAEAESEAIAVGYLMKGMPNAPTAVIAWLERRFRDRWSRTERVEHAGDGGGAIRIETVREKVLADIDAIAQRLLEDANAES
jgi:hypothetical protein